MIKSVQPKEETRYSAVLLLGPTGSGKTPLGGLLEKRGLWGLDCLHFDFGRELRRAVAEEAGVLGPSEREVVRLMLSTNSLLEDEHFGIARKLLENFITCRHADLKTLIVLNGLPRHIGQARRFEEIVRMIAVVSLECSPETVMQRIRLDIGGDRSDRVDDSLEEVKRKLEMFRRRTKPLVDYYRECHIGILRIEVTPTSTAEDLWASLNQSVTAVDNRYAGS